MNLPNILTMIRFALIPIMVYLLALEQYWQGIAIYTLASITDVLDGYIARKYNLITPLGKILDPTADKLLQFSALIMLNIKTGLPIWITVVFFAKEILMAIGAYILYKKNVVVQARWYGKLATSIFFVAIILAILSAIFTELTTYSIVLIYIAIAITLFAFVMYFINYMVKKKVS